MGKRTSTIRAFTFISRLADRSLVMGRWVWCNAKQYNHQLINNESLVNWRGMTDRLKVINFWCRLSVRICMWIPDHIFCHCRVGDFRRFISIFHTVASWFLRYLTKWLKPTREWIHSTLSPIRQTSGFGLIRKSGFEFWFQSGSQFVLGRVCGLVSAFVFCI